MVDLLVEQIEFADVIVLNKIDDAPRQDNATPPARLSGRLIPRPISSRPSFANAPLDRILNTGRFDFERAQQHPLWFKELYGFADHKPETEEYGVSTSSIARAGRSSPRNFTNS